MIRMKKILCLLLAILTVLPLFIGCGETDPASSGEPSVSKEPIAATGMEWLDTYEMVAGTVWKPEPVFLPEGAEALPFTVTSGDEKILQVAGDKLMAIREGTAKVILTAGEFTAMCTVTVKLPPDPLDSIDLSKGSEIKNLGGYMGIFRVKSSGELMFSPNLNEVRDSVSNGQVKYSDFTAYLRFTALKDSGNKTYATVEVPPVQSKGDWVDFYLQGEELDCGFCPTAGVNYRVELVVVYKESGECFCHGVYEPLQAPADFKASDYYRPTDEEGQSFRPTGVHTISYASAGHGMVEGNTVQTLLKDEKSTLVKAIPEEGYSFAMWSDGVLTAEREGDTADADMTLFACFVQKMVGQITVAEMNIDTETKKPVTNKQYQGATVTISGAAEDKRNVTVTGKIRGRGNSSFSGSAPQNSYDSKNSYRLSFDEPIKLLGVGDSKNKDWVLNANKFDVSGLRNRMVWDMANLMGTIPYVPDCTWVQLSVNGKYRGLYMVTELVETAKDRVNVDEDDGTDRENVGFLIEMDFRGNYDDEPYFYVDGYGPSPESDLHGAVEFCIKSKLSDNPALQQKQVDNIKNYVLECNKAIVRGKQAEIEKLIDLKSFIDLYIIEEWGKDCDSGRASFFLQKNSDGKLYCTAPWDFDFCFGTYGPATNSFGMVSTGDDCCRWHALLLERKWFRELVVARMEELEDALQETMINVRLRGVMLTEANDRNDEQWSVYGNNFHQYVSSQVSSQLENYREHIDFLVDWAEDRWENLKDELKYW